MDGIKFEGTIASAKAVKAWADSDAVVWGSSFEYREDDSLEAGVNIVFTDTNGPVYQDVYAGEWVGRDAEGNFHRFTDAQWTAIHLTDGAP